MKVLLLTWLLLMTSTVQASCVILLHGLARTNSSMTALEKKLVDQDYHVINDGYPSRGSPIEELAEIAISPALEKCTDYD